MPTPIITNGNLHSAAPGLQAKSCRDVIEASAIVCKIKPIIADEFVKTVIDLIRSATKSVDVAAYTWKWYDHQASCGMQRINYAIIERARHRLPIRCRFNHEHKDHVLTRENTRTAGHLRRYPVEIRFDGTEIMSHLKLFIIDKEIAILGSHNLTARSVGQNRETSVAIFGREAVKAYADYFEALWKKQL